MQTSHISKTFSFLLLCLQGKLYNKRKMYVNTIVPGLFADILLYWFLLEMRSCYNVVKFSEKMHKLQQMQYIFVVEKFVNSEKVLNKHVKIYI